jgi:hypothetical protein
MKSRAMTTVSERAPVASWLDDCRDDWLRGLVREGLEAGGDGAGILGVARFRRFRVDSLGPVAARNLVHRYMDPDASLDADPATAWIRRQGSAVVAAALDMAGREIGLLSSGLHALVNRRPERDARRWVRAFVAQCHRRDDVQAIHDLLALRLEGRGAAFDPLDGLDMLGGKAADLMPPLGEVFDERLARVASWDPDAWWVRPVVLVPAMMHGNGNAE